MVDEHSTSSLTICLQFEITLGQVKKILTDGQVVIEWGRLQRIDSEAGNTMHSSGLGTIQDDSQDATHVQVC